MPPLGGQARPPIVEGQSGRLVAVLREHVKFGHIEAHGLDATPVFTQARLGELGCTGKNPDVVALVSRDDRSGIVRLEVRDDVLALDQPEQLDPPLVRGLKHYYRLQGPTFLIEYDNTQNDGNHIHSVWRDFDRDFGRDLLRDHLKGVPHQP